MVVDVFLVKKDLTAIRCFFNGRAMPQSEHPEKSDIQTPTAEETNVVTHEATPEAPASDAATATALPAEPTGRRVSSVADYEKMLEQAKAATEPAEPKAGDDAPPTAQEGATQAEPEAGKPQQESEVKDPDDLEAPPDDSPKKGFRPRLSNLDSRQQEAILLVKELKDKGQDISLSEAERRVNAKYGVTEQASESGSQEPPKEEPTFENRIGSIAEQIAAKQAAADAAAEELDVKTALLLQREITALELEKIRLEAAEQAKSGQEDAKFQEQVDRSRSRAVEIYPVAQEKDHPIHTKASEIWETLQATNNPLINDPDAPFRVYQMAANELSIAPLSSAPSKAASPKSAPLGAPKPQAIQQQAVRRPNPVAPVASAGDRTTQQGPATHSFGKIRNAHEYSEVARKLGANV